MLADVVLFFLHPTHPNRPVRYVPDEGMGYTILDTCGWKH